MRTLLNKSILSLLLVFALCSNSTIAGAQGFSYVYIQGDKKTPIYVKVEGEMLPRYGKNYALISRLAPGPLNIDILFQQNEHPPMHFTVLVPENGKRAFMVNKKEGAFCLYDLEQNFYLRPDNDIADDHLPSVIANADLLGTATAKEPELTEAEKEPETAPARPKTPKASPATAKKTIAKKVLVPKPQPATAQPKDSSPKFIDNITLNNDKSGGSQATQTASTDNIAASEQPIPNSDCRSVIPVGTFRRLMITINARKTEDEKLGTFLEAVSQYCFTTDMTAEVVGKLSTDAARFSALKKVYPKTTDQARFATLEQLLSDAEWKEYFRDMVTH